MQEMLEKGRFCLNFCGLLRRSELYQTDIIDGWELLDLLKIIMINNYLQTVLWQVQSMQN